MDLDQVAVKISKLMPELGFVLEDSDRLVASFSSGWQMRMCLGKILLQIITVAWRIDDIKGLLGRCNFKADMLDRKVSLLSGGEKVRLAFCKFIVKPSTLLVLDEPTNHLDIQSKEMLEEAISEHQGTVIAISHDRYFIRQIVNRVVVKDEVLQDYAGNYNYYLEKNLEAREKELEREAELEEKAPKPKAKSKMSKVKFY